MKRYSIIIADEDGIVIDRWTVGAGTETEIVSEIKSFDFGRYEDFVTINARRTEDLSLTFAAILRNIRDNAEVEAEAMAEQNRLEQEGDLTDAERQHQFGEV